MSSEEGFSILQRIIHQCRTYPVNILTKDLHSNLHSTEIYKSAATPELRNKLWNDFFIPIYRASEIIMNEKLKECS